MTPHLAIARAFWLREQFRNNENFDAAVAWYDREITKPNRGQAGDSAIGKCLDKADRVLRLLEAAGVKAEMME